MPFTQHEFLDEDREKPSLMLSSVFNVLRLKQKSKITEN